MESRQLIITFMFSERIKSELIIASQVLDQTYSLEGDERTGAEKLLVTYLRALLGEIRIAKSIERSINFIGAEKKIMEALGRIKLLEHEELNRCISDAISFVTTSSQKAMEMLMEKKLL